MLQTITRETNAGVPERLGARFRPASSGTFAGICTPIFRLAMSDGAVEFNPASGLFIPACKQAPAKRVMTKEDVRLALGVLDVAARLIAHGNFRRNASGRDLRNPTRQDPRQFGSDRPPVLLQQHGHTQGTQGEEYQSNRGAVAWHGSRSQYLAVLPCGAGLRRSAPSIGNRGHSPSAEQPMETGGPTATGASRVGMGELPRSCGGPTRAFRARPRWMTKYPRTSVGTDWA